jgi:hypothetical protein
MTSLTRCGIGALDPTHGQAVETASAFGAAVTARRDAAAVVRISPMISGLLIRGLFGTRPSRRYFLALFLALFLKVKEGKYNVNVNIL